MVREHINRCFILAALGALYLMQMPLSAAQPEAAAPASQPAAVATDVNAAPAEDPKFEAYLAELRRKAEQGDADAAWQLAVHYEVSRNLSEGAKWITRFITLKEQAANAGDANAMYDLGKTFYNGLRIYPRNKETAFGWFQRAADAGHADAQYRTAHMLSKGEGVRPDAVKAAEYYRKALETWQKAADNGDGHAALWVGLIYEKNQVPDSTPEKSVPWLIKSADKGVPMAFILLAFKYRDGQGVPQDAARAVEWFEKAAARNDLGAIMELGMLYRDGKALPKDEAKAREWFAKGVELKDPYSMHALADMLMTDSPAHDQARALELYRTAAEIGYVPSALKAAEILRGGKTGSADREQAIKMLRKLTDDPYAPTVDPRVRLLLADIYYEDGMDSQANALLSAAAQDGYTPAMNRMAMAYLTPGSPIGWNPVMSYFYWDKAGQLGDEECADRAFWLLCSGVGIMVVVAALLVWKFNRFATRRQAELAKLEEMAQNGNKSSES